MLTLTGIQVSVAHAEPLSFSVTLAIAERESPDLAAQNADIDAARSASVAAGRWPDPKLLVGIENLPASGVDQWSLNRDFMTMQKVGVMQEIPNGSKRRAEAEVATAAIDRAEAEWRVKVIGVRRAAALAWLDRYYLERRGALFDELDRENQLFAESVQAQLAGSKGMLADTVVPKQEAAELADRRDELSASIAKAKSALRRYVGAIGDDPLAGDAPLLAIDAEQLRTQIHKHPELAVFAPLLAMAQGEVHEAEAMKKPDWGIELAYAKRGSQFSDMVSMQVTVGLPLFTGNRQNPQIAAKRQTVNKVNAERDAMLRDHTQELEADLADYDTLTRQLARMQTTRLPLAQQKVDLQFASYRAGKGDLNAVLTARRELIAERLKQLDLDSQRVAAAARLYFAYGEGSR
ncbi:MAG: TolC family protein [Steroidobacteraceae bacterium]